MAVPLSGRIGSATRQSSYVLGSTAQVVTKHGRDKPVTCAVTNSGRVLFPPLLRYLQEKLGVHRQEDLHDIRPKIRVNSVVVTISKRSTSTGQRISPSHAAAVMKLRCLHRGSHRVGWLTPPGTCVKVSANELRLADRRRRADIPFCSLCGRGANTCGGIG